MADVSRDPVAAAKMDRLEAELIALREQLQTGLVATEQAAAEVRGVAAAGAVRPTTISGEAASVVEPATIRQATTGMDSLLAAAERVAGVVRETTGELGTLTGAERGAAAAAEERLAIQQRELATIREAAGSLGQTPVAAPAVTPAGRAVESLQAAQAAESVAQIEAAARAARAAAPAAATPPPAEPSVGPVNTVRLSEISDLTRAQQNLLGLARELAPAERLVSAEMEHTARSASLASLAYQRHGALTTEFIAAAAKGQVTIGELGNQMLLTIGKFAGWTAAAAATYGMVGVLGEVAKGASETASGVNQLQRFIDNVDTTKAQEQFRQLSEANNVSIKDSADAVASFAKIFQNQGEAVAAADIALKATQLDQISLADSTRFLTGAIVGFHLPASQLPIVFDQINNAQRRFGASVAQTLAAVGGSAAAVRNAGGDFNTYIALITAAQRATAQTGSVIGTAFRRSATTFVTKPTNQAILRSFGLDPTEAYTSLVLDAVEKAKNLTGPQINRLAQGLGGQQQGARVFAGLLNRPDLVTRALDVTSPAKASGSAAEEMGHKLAQADQQIKAVTFSLERLGSSLAQSGALTPFLALIGGFRDVADAVSHVLDLVNQLPAGLGQVLVPLAEVAAAFRVLRNLDLGGRISPGGVLAPVVGSSDSSRSSLNLLRPSAGRQAQKDFEKGLDEQRAYYEQLSASSAQTSSRLSAQVAAKRAYVVELASSGAADESIAAEMRRVVSLQEQAAAAIFEQEYYRQAINELDRMNNNRLAAIRAGVGADEAAAAAGFTARPGSLDRPTGGSPVILPPGVTRETGVAAEGLAADAEAATAEATVAGGAVARAGAVVREEAIAIRGLGARMLGFVAGLGPLGLAFAGFAVGAPIYNALSKAQSTLDAATRFSEPTGQPVTVSSDLANLRVQQYVERTVGQASGFSTLLTNTNLALDRGVRDISKAIDRFAGAGASVPDFGLGQRKITLGADNPLQQQLDALQKRKKELGGFWVNVESDLNDLLTTPVTNAGVAVLDPGGQDSSIAKRKDTIDQAIAQQQQLLSIQARQLYTGQAAIDLPASTIEAQMKDSIERFKVGLISYKQLQREFAKGMKEIELSPALGGGDIATIHQVIADASARLHTTVSSISQDLKSLTGAQLDKQITDYANYLRLFGSQSSLGRGALTHLSAILGELAGRAAFDPSGIVDKSGTTNLDKFAQGEQAITSAIQQQVQEDLTLALRTAHTRAERQAAYNAAAANAKRLTVGVQEAIAKQKAYIANLEKEAAAERIEEAGLDATGRAVQSAVQSTIDLINNFTGQLQGILGNIGIIASIGGVGNAKLRQTLASINQQQAALKVLQAFQNHANKVTADTIAGYQGLGAKANPTPKVPTTPASQDPFETERLRREILRAQEEGDPVAQAHADQQLAQREIAVARNIHERLQGQLDLVNADNELAKAIADQAQAVYTYRESLTQDPVKQAVIEYQAAVAAVAAAERQGGPNTADSLNARAKQNDARQKLIDARIQASEDTIQFDLDMGRITSETAIREYDALLKVHGLTLAKKRQVLEDIKRLQDQNSTENLNLGTIRLPTAYEIRRAYQAAVSGPASGPGSGVNVTQHFSTTIQVTDTASAGAVGVQMDNYNRGTGKAIKRALAMR